VSELLNANNTRRITPEGAVVKGVLFIPLDSERSPGYPPKMPPLALLVAALLTAPAHADPDPVAQIRQDTARIREVNQRPADTVVDQAPSATYAAEREAAVAFVDMVRRLPNQRMEYCAYILRGADKRFGFSAIRQGDMDKCPSDRPRPAAATALVHTHPLWGRSEDPSVAGQMFSEADFNFSESDEMRLPIYLGAPAGHVLRYAPGGTACRGESLMRRDFEIVRDARPSVRGLLPINPGVDMPLYSEAGKKLPKPSYCRPL
jgi:uncharacterized protein DUF4329